MKKKNPSDFKSFKIEILMDWFRLTLSFSSLKKSCFKLRLEFLNKNYANYRFNDQL